MGRSALERVRHLRFTKLQLMKNLKNFWIDEAKKHGSCYFNPFAPGDFAEKRVLKLVEWFSGHCRAIKN